MKKVLVSGGTGFVGRALTQALLRQQDEVTVASRDPRREEGLRWRHVVWDTESGRGMSPALVAEQDAIVHLVGAPAVGVRWTRRVKRAIHDSRVESTRQLVEALREAAPRPQVLVCASAVGYYGPRPAREVVDETGEPGSDFLATVCVAWEAAARAATDFGVRVVSARLGVVLGRGGGALPSLVAPFHALLGGTIAGGRQMVSWIHLEDAVRGLIRCLDDEALKGAVNVTAPRPVANRELATTLGRVLRRPAWVNVPASALRLRFGDGAEPLATGQAALPAKLRSVGFEWRYPELSDALSELLDARST